MMCILYTCTSIRDSPECTVLFHKYTCTVIVNCVPVNDDGDESPCTRVPEAQIRGNVRGFVSPGEAEIRMFFPQLPQVLVGQRSKYRIRIHSVGSTRKFRTTACT